MQWQAHKYEAARQQDVPFPGHPRRQDRDGARVQDELERAAVSHALLSACMANSYDHELELAFAQHPTGVWTLKSFKAKALKLPPCGNVSKLKGDIPTNKIALKAGSSKFVVTPYPKVFAHPKAPVSLLRNKLYLVYFKL